MRSAHRISDLEAKLASALETVEALRAIGNVWESPSHASKTTGQHDSCPTNTPTAQNQ